MSNKHYDVAIVGAGPAGLQAALMLARTRKKIIVFDSPEPPRNHASHGVHNFVGLDGLLPSEIRAQAWQQIQVYGSAELCIERIVDIQPNAKPASFSLQGENGTVVTAQHVVLAMGYRDVYPDVPGFTACWGDTIIPCPFCDGYENRDHVWGLVATSDLTLEHMPMLFRNWTQTAKLILSPAVSLHDEQREALVAQGIPVHVGDIVEVHHTGSKVTAVTLSSGEQVAVETLWWRPDEAPLALTQRLIETFNLDLDAHGFIQTDSLHQTSMKGLWAVGDVRGWAGALGAAFAASQAATGITREWYMHSPVHST